MKHTLLPFLAALLLPAFAQATTYNVSVANFSFTPASVVMNLGDTITWNWSAGAHTTTSTTIPSGATTWDQPITQSNTSFTYVPTKVGTYNYKCTPHSSLGMVGSFTVNCVSAPPYNISQLHPNGVCVNSIVNGRDTFIASSTLSGTTFTYSSANATFNPISTSVTEAIPGTTGTSALVKIVITSTAGCKDSTTKTITFVNPPAASYTTVKSGLTVTFTNTTPGTNNTYSWNFGDGSAASTAVNPVHTYVKGNYTACLTATNATGCSQQFCFPVSLSVGNVYPALFTMSPNPAGSILNIHLAESLPLDVMLQDITGKTLIQQHYANNKEASLDITKIAPGLYNVRVAQDGQYHTEKLIIAR